MIIRMIYRLSFICLMALSHFSLNADIFDRLQNWHRTLWISCISMNVKIKISYRFG